MEAIECYRSAATRPGFGENTAGWKRGPGIELPGKVRVRREHGGMETPGIKTGASTYLRVRQKHGGMETVQAVREEWLYIRVRQKPDGMETLEPIGANLSPIWV